MEDRYKHLLLKFAIKCAKNERTKDILPMNAPNGRTRHQETFTVPFARKERFRKSTIPTMARLLNDRGNK